MSVWIGKVPIISLALVLLAAASMSRTHTAAFAASMDAATAGVTEDGCGLIVYCVRGPLNSLSEGDCSNDSASPGHKLRGNGNCDFSNLGNVPGLAPSLYQLANISEPTFIPLSPYSASKDTGGDVAAPNTEHRSIQRSEGQDTDIRSINGQVSPLAIDIVETIGVVDSSQVQPAVLVSVVEEISASDSSIVSPAIQVDVIESVGVSDSVEVVPPVLINVAESIGIADMVDVIPPVIIGIVEVVGVTDSPNALPSVLINVAESIGIADLVDIIPPVIIGISEVVGVTDSPNALPSVLINVAESIGIADLVDVIPPVVIGISEVVGVSDSASALPSVLINVAESIGIADLVDVIPPVIIGIVEVVGVTDSPNVLPPVVIGLVEVVGVTDSSNALPSVIINVAESVGVNDLVDAIPPVIIGVVEVVGVTDSSNALPSVLINVAESIGIADLVNAIPPVVINVAEVVGVVDLGQVLPPIILFVAENIGVADGPQVLGAILIKVVESISVSDLVETIAVESFEDQDLDGIDDAIDGFIDPTTNAFVSESEISSNRFTDKHLGGTSFGVIDDPAGLEITVFNATSLAGVLIELGTGSNTANLTACDDPEATLLFGGGTSAVVSCGSLIADVLTGPVRVLLNNLIEVEVPSHTTVTITEPLAGQFDIENSFDSVGSAVVQVGGQEVQVAPGDSAAGVSPSIVCGEIITTNITLGVLANDLIDCPGNGVEIHTDNLTLDCGGHSISGTGTGSGILVRADNVTVRNCHVSKFLSGIDNVSPSGAAGNYFLNNTLNGNSSGLISQGPNNTFEANTANNNALRGFHIINGAGNSFQNNVANENGAEGILVTNLNGLLLANTTNNNGQKGISLLTASNTTVEGNTADGNGQYGIYLQTANNNNISGNSAMNNGSHGFQLQSVSTNNRLTGNQSLNNGSVGINIQSPLDELNTLKSNYVEGNNIGIQIRGQQTVINNTTRLNTLNGFLLTNAVNSVLDGNLIEDNSPLSVPGVLAGIFLSGGSNDNSIINNTIVNNLQFGIQLRNGNTDNEFNNNFIINNPTGVIFAGGTAEHSNKFYNNFFNNDVNVSNGSDAPNTWNIAKTVGTNILGGPFLGGNFWGMPDGTGFSQTCTDSELDGICDNFLVFGANNVDEFPLKDISPPVLAVPSDITLEAEGPSGVAVDNLTIEAFLSDASAEDIVDGPVLVDNDAPLDFFPLGVTTVTFSATDSSGNTNTGTADVNIVDTTPPELTLPAKISVAAEDELGIPAKRPSIEAFLASASAEDIVDGPVSVTNDAPDIFPLGTTTVVFSATDGAGNTATGESSVTVIEDGDGIQPGVDGQLIGGKFTDESLIFSDSFTDIHLDKGATFGTIVDRGGLVVTIEDLVSPGGILIGADGAATGVSAINVCDQIMKLGAGKLVNVTCGSLTIDVIAGPVSVLDSGEGITVSMSSGTTATVTETTQGSLEIQLNEDTLITMSTSTTATITELSEGDFEIVNESQDGAAPITITTQGSKVVIDAGESLASVSIDIKPDNDPNPINLGSEGVIPVAVLTTSVADGDLLDFDVAEVDQSSLTLAGAAAKVKGKSGNIGSFEDVDSDGDLDLVVHFPTADLSLTELDTEAVLDGRTLDGSSIHGSDSIIVVP